MWVFDYKFTAEGFLDRLKARLVVRGDQMWWGSNDTYAATLTAKSFRLLLVVIAYFNLEAKQLDVVSAFLNSILNKKVYIRHPPSFYKYGKYLLLRHALYRLPRALKLWYKTLVEILSTLGLKKVHKEPYILANDWLLIFFFVDDSTIVYRPEDHSRA